MLREQLVEEYSYCLDQLEKVSMENEILKKKLRQCEHLLGQIPRMANPITLRPPLQWCKICGKEATIVISPIDEPDYYLCPDHYLQWYQRRRKYGPRSNPPNEDLIDKALERSQTFNMINHKGRIHKVKIDLPDPDEPLVKIGKMIRCDYLSKKEGQDINYFHRFKPPYPTLYFSLNEKKPTLIVSGGRYKVTDWLIG